MAVQKREVEYAKEIDDVAALLVKVLSDAKAGKPAAEIASGAVTELINALAGLDQAGEEAKNRRVLLQTLGYRTGEMAGILLGEPSQQVVNPVAPA